jgi:serine O-acetyltransferase
VAELTRVPVLESLRRDFSFCRELCGGSALQAFASYGLYPTLAYRYARRATAVRWWPLRWALLTPYQFVRVPLELLIGISIARTADIGVPVMFHHHGGVFVAAGVRLGSGCQIFQGVTVGEGGGRRTGRPSLGDRVIVGAGAKILGPVAIGSDARIGANAVVLEDVPAGATAVGVPAVVKLVPVGR